MKTNFMLGIQKRSLSVLLVAITLAVGTAEAEDARPQSTTLREWRIEDALKIASPVPSEYAKNRFYLSPRNAFVALLTTYGELETDSVVTELRIFRSSDIRQALADGTPAIKPFRVLRVSAQPEGTTEFTGRSGDALNELKWDADEESLLYTAEDKPGIQCIKRYSIADNKESIIVSLDTKALGISLIDDYWYSEKSLIIAARAQQFTGEVVSYPAYRPKRVREIDSAPPYSRRNSPLVFANWEPMVLIAVAPGNEPRKVPIRDATAARHISQEMISPDGSMLIVPDRSQTGTRYILIDVLNKYTEPKILGEVGGRASEGLGNAPQIYWSDDGQYVLFTNLAFTTGNSKPEASVCEYRVEGATTRQLFRLSDTLRDSFRPQKVVSFEQSGRTLSAIGNGDTQARSPINKLEGVYSHADEILHNTAEAASAASPLGFTTEVEQGMNIPMRYYARRGEKKTILLDSAESIQGIKIISAREISWPIPGGTRKGTLWVPETATASHSAPVVLQLDALGMPNDVFMVEGHISGCSNAAQALAAAGIAVVNVPLHGFNDIKNWKAGPGEAEAVNEEIESVVRELRKMPEIDCTKIGITGFSRAGWYVYFALTHPRSVRFAAAVCCDSLRGSFAETISAGLIMDSRLAFRETPGAFWQNRQSWNDWETSFNADKIQTPTLFTLNGERAGLRSNPVGSIDIAAYLLNKKPVDVLFFPRGSHPLQRPRERVILTSTVVDWMKFWFQGELNPDPELKERNANWAEMKKAWQ